MATDWLRDNLATIISVLPTCLVVLRTFITEGLGGGREFRRIRRHAELRSLLISGSTAAKQMDRLLETELEDFVARASYKTRRKIDGTNLAALIVVSIVGGAISYGLILWSQSLTGFWAIVLWSITILVIGFLLLLILLGAVPKLFKDEAD